MNIYCLFLAGNKVDRKPAFQKTKKFFHSAVKGFQVNNINRAGINKQPVMILL